MTRGRTVIAHIPDGVLSLPVLAAGSTASVVALGVAVARLRSHDIPRTAVLAAVFFVASLMTLPVGPTTVHPLLNGLMGLVLGWAAIPAIVVSLFLQMIFFGFGGLTAFGVNVFNIAVPALVVALTLRPWLVRVDGPRRAGLIGALSGAGGVLLTGALVSASLALSSPAYLDAAKVAIITYLPLAAGEAAI
ncbi:MAG: cobalt transporter CbiM, partial [Alphaproteobacteria bacterium]